MRAPAFVLPWILLLTSTASAVSTTGCNDATYSLYQYIEQQLEPTYCAQSPWLQATGTKAAQAASACVCLHPGLNTLPPTPTPTLAPTRTSTSVRVIVAPTGPVPNPWAHSPVTVPTATACGLPGLSQQYINSSVLHHNYHRYNHSASKVSWDCNLASYARLWAMQCQFSHNNQIGSPGYGQNIAAGYNWDQVGYSITQSWYYDEVNNFAPWYGHADPGDGNYYNVWNDPDHEFGHFAQLVWNGTSKIGCFTNYCPGGIVNGQGTLYITVCNYMGPGNVLDQYAKNVFPPRKSGVLPTINGSFVPPSSFL